MDTRLYQSASLRRIEAANAAEFLRTHHQAPTVLVGHSLGGAAVLAVAEQR